MDTTGCSDRNTPDRCATPGCTRTTDWPRDPGLRAAYCRECTNALLLPERMLAIADFRRRWTAEVGR